MVFVPPLELAQRPFTVADVSCEHVRFLLFSCCSIISVICVYALD